MSSRLDILLKALKSRYYQELPVEEFRIKANEALLIENGVPHILVGKDKLSLSLDKATMNAIVNNYPAFDQSLARTHRVSNLGSSKSLETKVSSSDYVVKEVVYKDNNDIFFEDVSGNNSIRVGKSAVLLLELNGLSSSNVLLSYYKELELTFHYRTQGGNLLDGSFIVKAYKSDTYHDVFSFLATEKEIVDATFTAKLFRDGSTSASLETVRSMVVMFIESLVASLVADGYLEFVGERAYIIGKLGKERGANLL